MQELEHVVGEAFDAKDYCRVAEQARSLPTHAAPLEAGLAKLYHRLGLSLILAPGSDCKANDYVLARQWLLKALACSAHGDVPAILVDLAALAYQLGDHWSERKAVRSLSRRVAGEWGFHASMHRALSLSLQGRHRWACRLYREAVKLAGANCQRAEIAYLLLQEANMENGDVCEAEKNLCSFTASDDDYEGMRLALLAEIDRRSARFTRALNHAVRAYLILNKIKSAKNVLPGAYLHRVRLTLLRVYRHLGDLERSNFVYVELIADPMTPDDIRTLAYALACNKDTAGGEHSADMGDEGSLLGGRGFAH